MDVLLIAAYLHDIGRCFQDASAGAVCHAEKGAQMAWPIVKDSSFAPLKWHKTSYCLGKCVNIGANVHQGIGRTVSAVSSAVGGMR